MDNSLENVRTGTPSRCGRPYLQVNWGIAEGRPRLNLYWGVIECTGYEMPLSLRERIKAEVSAFTLTFPDHRFRANN